MTERTPWWRAFLPPKRKSGGHKDTGSNNPYSPDFNPFEQKSEKKKDPTAAASKTPGTQAPAHEESNKLPDLASDDTFDDSHLDSVFNEQTCRRNMKVSRSGRFKEKKKVRSSLPIQEKEPETVPSGKEDIRWK